MLGLIVVLATPIVALRNGVGLTPAMGWSAKNLGCSVTEQIVREVADSLVSSGLADLGYVYLDIGGCWQAKRDTKGFILEDTTLFPSGITVLAEYLNSKGLKLGLTSSASTQTCNGKLGGLYYENQDAQSYAKWNVDFVKYNNCNVEGVSDKSDSLQRYGALRDALNATNKRINYAISSNGENGIWEFGADLGNSWRTTDGIRDSWESVVEIMSQNVNLAKYAAPGGFNDMDMLQVGNGGMTDEEYRAHFSIWAALKSPLFLSHDITKLTRTTMDIIGNEEVTAINQDPLGKSAYLRAVLQNIFVWVGELANGERLLMVVNNNDKPVSLDIGIGILGSNIPITAVVQIRDLWQKKDLGLFAGTIRLTSIPPHGSRMLRVTKRKGDFPPLSTSSLDNDLLNLSDAGLSFIPLAVVLTFAIGMSWVRSRRQGYVQLT
ncbi:alpha-galactosidase [Rhizoclosmatium globosum]|uniref:Alpha-galactosidase n=1 Tax=Rhizoclosmatium globosum TaxID=329046 RepID=A0A1Y2BXY6_9FUNG|nr:alpha-galactosidase [Rhizoclosmatium globosum]|eukprot:ORY39623.1 alpha-galactosidase [Rhizoclosmatium globosum]